MPDLLPSAASSPQPAPQAAPAAALARRARWRIALLGLFGALALLLPLAQVLRFQVEALADVRDERSLLDPLAEAMDLHQGLAGHDEVASRVLRGRTALEGERRERQAGVDRALTALQATLWAGRWTQARREAASLQTGWRELVAQVEQRAIAVEASRQGHRLLQEQAMQVMDLVTAQQPDGSAARTLAALPRAQWPAYLASREQALVVRRSQAVSTAAWLLLALAAGLGVLGLLGSGLRRQGADGGTPTAPAVRLGHGRRAGDRPPTRAAADIAHDELLALRRSAQDEPSEPRRG